MSALFDEAFALLRSQDSGRDSAIVTSQSHGDFQPANVLVTEQGGWLIDWERTDKRQIAYDALVYTLNSRMPQGLAHRVETALAMDGGPEATVLRTWPGMDWSNRHYRRTVLLLFLMEEMVFHLAENSTPVFFRLGSGLKRICSEMGPALRVLG